MQIQRLQEKNRTKPGNARRETNDQDGRVHASHAGDAYRLAARTAVQPYLLSALSIPSPTPSSHSLSPMTSL